jgi:hypothetical protein
MEDGERWTEIPPLNNLAEDKSTLLEGVVAAGMRHGFSLILNKVNSNCDSTLLARDITTTKKPRADLPAICD